MKNAQERLRDHGLKATPQRMAIIRAIEKTGHITIDDLYRQVREEMPSISLATVYKNLTGLQEAGVVFQLTPPGQKAKYETVKGEHAHMVCKNCGEVADIRVDTEEAARSAAEKSGYEISTVTLYMEGTCPECK